MNTSSHVSEVVEGCVDTENHEDSLLTADSNPASLNPEAEVTTTSNDADTQDSRHKKSKSEIYNENLSRLFNVSPDYGIPYQQKELVYLLTGSVVFFLADERKSTNERRLWGFAHLSPEVIVGTPQELSTGKFEILDLNSISKKGLKYGWNDFPFNVGDQIFFHASDMCTIVYSKQDEGIVPVHPEIGVVGYDMDSEYPETGDTVIFRLHGVPKGIKAFPWFSQVQYEKACNDYACRTEYRVTRVEYSGLGLPRSRKVAWEGLDQEAFQAKNDNKYVDRYSDRQTSDSRVKHIWEKRVLPSADWVTTGPFWKE